MILSLNSHLTLFDLADGKRPRERALVAASTPASLDVPEFEQALRSAAA